jgi:hypothetical protein
MAREKAKEDVGRWRDHGWDNGREKREWRRPLRVDRGSPKPVGNGVCRRDPAAGMLPGAILHLGTACKVHGGSSHLGLQIPLGDGCSTLDPAVDGYLAWPARCVACH